MELGPLAETWPVWRLITERVATLQEIETFWSIDDVLDANDALDALAEAEHKAHEAAKRKR